MATPLLATKLYVPSPRPDLVPRPELLARLNQGLALGHRLTLVSAPAGSGKTSILAQWVANLERPVAWISLDPEDDEPARFWRYLLSAFQTIDPGLGRSAVQILASSPAPTPRAILTPLLNDLAACQRPLVLVLDDYHTISAPPIHESMVFLVEYGPPGLHLALATRADPPLPLSRLRARRQLTELRMADLRFGPEAASAFLQGATGLDLGPEDLQALEARTEGWIVGLQLAALALRDALAAGPQEAHVFVQQFAGSHHYVLEYLTEEVVHRQPEEVRAFLLETSLLTRLQGSLCDAVTGREDGAEVLAQLYQQNLFITPLDPERRWYRYHHLFADLLGNLLRREASPERVCELHRRASLWYEAQGWPEEAIEHALKAGEPERVADLLEEGGGSLVQGQVAKFLAWAGKLPQELLRPRPRLLASLGWALFLAGHPGQARERLLQAREALAGLPPTEERQALRGVVASRLANVEESAPDIMREAEEALAYLPANDWVSRARATLALSTARGLEGDTAYNVEAGEQASDLALRSGNLFLAAAAMSMVASTWVHQGRLRAAARGYQDLLDRLQHLERFPPAGLGYVGLADVWYEWNDLDACQRDLQLGIELCQEGGIGYNLTAAYCLQARLGQTQGDIPGAEASLRQAEAYARSLSSRAHLLWHGARLALLRHDLAAAQPAVEALRRERWPLVISEVAQMVQAHWALLRGDGDQVLAIYRQLEPQARAGGRWARVLEISVLAALALHVAGQGEKALEPLRDALTIAAPEGHTRAFVDLGAPMAELLRLAAAAGIQPSYVDRLLSAFERLPSPSEQPARAQPPEQEGLVEPLTERELEILSLISQGQTNQQIAERLFVTINTVKKHASNLYGKLGVNSRTQAAARGRELGLVDD